MAKGQQRSNREIKKPKKSDPKKSKGPKGPAAATVTSVFSPPPQNKPGSKRT